MKIRKGKNYRYGIHVRDMKFLCSDAKIENMPSPKTVSISLSQHIGAPALPVVNVGDKVKKGTLIGKENGGVSANVYSSVSGTVTEIKKLTNGIGQTSEYVIIENDFTNEEVLFDAIKEVTKESIIERVRLSGIVGLGGAGFPTAVKLTPKNKLDALIINGAECEPYLNCDNRLMLERTDDIYKGIILLKKALDVDKVIIGIEKNKMEAVKAFSKYQDLDIVVLKKQYPMGSEKHLIYVTTGRKVPVGKMPFDVNVSVQNVKTALAVYEAVELNKPLTEVVLTVSGKGVKNPKNLKVAIGTPFSEIFDFCGGYSEDTVKFVAGGPMMGRGMQNLNSFVRKTDSGILALSKEETGDFNPTHCINCGRCADNCPMRLIPALMEERIQADDITGAEKLGVMNCLECGSCAYNCPAKRPLTQDFSFAKAKIREMKAKEKK